MPQILHIAIPTPLYKHFDYLPPDECDISQLQPGFRIRVPFGKNEMIGILLSTSNTSHVDIKKLKKAISIIDTQSLLPSSIISLIHFSSDYYHYPIGEVYASALPTLLRQGRDTQYRHHAEEFEALPEVPPVLSDAQEKAVKTILEKTGTFQAYLLFGVTGSGKTEVYLQVIKEVLNQNKQALVLVPEIGLTPQTVSRFQKRFSVGISVLHSGLTDKERHDAWLQACHGDSKIVIGTRSAIFTPLKNPGVIIIDEEHDLSFKQQEGFRYCARDLALLRAQLEKIPVILGSATPSLESFHNVSLEKYHCLTLPERAGSAVHPIFHVVDLRKKNLQHGLSSELLDCMSKHLKNKGQILVFINRRGFAPSLICHQCGWISHCHRCDANMIVHRQPLHLECHHCGASRGMDHACGDCGEKQLFPLGAGTERIEEVLQNIFPTVSIIRIDRDTTRKKGSLEKKLEEIHEGEPCILVGTQMLAKGHHFPNVTLAVILNLDSGWFSSDFRGHERTGQLIVQVAGRAGRVEKPGEVIIQTYHPDNPLLSYLIEGNYWAFANASLEERKQAGLPPYQAMTLLRAESLNATSARQFLQELKDCIQPSANKNEVLIFGPIDAPMQKKAGKYRMQLLLQAKHRKALKNTLDELIQHLAEMKKRSRVRFSMDVDPQDLF